ncbi:hypothetical protein [Bradyrhizobium sp. STM 3562]|uniref:hypothetical protein n=1 Tax=Bradyrhizobium sp. STM 3562 TaxID=578924 RepID=UPI00388F65B9
MTVAGDVGSERGYSARGRSDWGHAQAEALYAPRYAEWIVRAQSVHRENFDPNQLEAASLVSIMADDSSQSCSYCSQIAHYATALKAARVMDCADLVATTRRQSRRCDALLHGRGWRRPKDRDLDSICEMVSAVKSLRMGSCITPGMLNLMRSARLAEAGLGFYSHNL